MTTKEKIIAICILVTIGATYRIFPHPPNFAPVAAISLFSGYYFRRYFVLAPIAIMFLSDWFIGFYDWKLMLVVYGSFMIISLLGIFMRRKLSLVSVIGFSLGSSILFFLTTNFAVWLFSSWYLHNLDGLARCYIAAIPFFKNTLAGDLFYTSILFGCFDLIAQPKEGLRFLRVQT